MGNWLGHLSLRFEQAEGQTFLAWRGHRGPLQVQRPFLDDSGSCQLYVLHPPGGVVGGDSLQIDVEAQHSSQVLLTAPGATKFYRSAGLLAHQTLSFVVKADALCEWLPQETVVFDGARVQSTMSVELESTANYAGWEVLCLGRPASGERFERGAVRQVFELARDGKLLWREVALWDATGEALNAPWGAQGKPVIGTFLLTGATQQSLDVARDQVEDKPAAVTRIGELLVVRYLGDSTEEARGIFQGLWAMLRPLLFSKLACPPRIWAT